MADTLELISGQDYLGPEGLKGMGHANNPNAKLGLFREHLVDKLLPKLCDITVFVGFDVWLCRKPGWKVRALELGRDGAEGVCGEVRGTGCVRA